ncbi:MAG: LptF/LptG family permease [candidate division WOR-3 bacterium]
MRLLHREVLKEFLPLFVFAILVLAFVLLMDRLFLLADLLVRKGVPVGVVGEIAFFSLPFVISISAPLGGLIGGVVTFGRMSQDNEVAVVRAAGVPAWRLFVPVLFLGALLVPVMVFFNGFVVPETQHRVRNLLTDIARKKPALRIQERIFMDDFPGYMVYIGSMDERRSTVTNVVIFERTRGNRTPAFITAPKGKISYTPDDRYLILNLYDGEIHELIESGNYRRLSFREHTINILTDDELVRRGREYRSDDELFLPNLFKQVATIKGDVAKLNQEVKKLSQQAQGDQARLMHLDELKTRLRYRRLEAVRSQTEIQKRFSLAFSCLFFLLFGAPVGLILRRGGIGTGFIIGLVFFAVYYILLLAGENMAESGKLTPFVGMWLPNLVLVLPVTELLSRTLFEFSPLRMLLTLKR